MTFERLTKGLLTLNVAKDSKLFLNWKPSKDIMSKVLLQDPVIIDVIVHALIGTLVYCYCSSRFSS